jgi:hypothetical protein
MKKILWETCKVLTPIILIVGFATFILFPFNVPTVCDIASKTSVGFLSDAKEIPTSFNDLPRMQLTVADINGINTGIYYIRDITNVQIKEEVFLVKNTCDTYKIKLGNREKLFKTFER